MQSIEGMSGEDAIIAQGHQANQQNLRSLTAHHQTVLGVVRHALFSSKSNDELFEYDFPALDHDKEFYRTLKHALFDFASKCFRTTAIYSNHERTFFADRVIPVFSAFENLHPNIHLEW